MSKKKDKSCVGFIEKQFNEELYGDIIDTMKAKGWEGFKAFFYAFFDKSCDNNSERTMIKKNPTRVMPVEAW